MTSEPTSVKEPEQLRVIYGPSRPGPIRRALSYVPRPYEGQDETDLARRGLLFKADQLDDVGTFIESGLVSTNRCVIVMFCDLKGSTPALGVLEKGFRDIQVTFFTSIADEVKRINSRLTAQAEGPYPRFVIDKFMGDGAMLYVDCGSGDFVDCRSQINAAAKPILQLVQKLADTIVELDGWNRANNRNQPSQVDHLKIAIGDKLEANDIRLGLRFGIALGSRVTLSVLGGSQDSNEGDFTLTGEVVNLAARLEHATPSEFLTYLADVAGRIGRFSSLLRHPEITRGTALGDAIDQRDQQVIDLYQVFDGRFEIRADSGFRKCLEDGPNIKLPWKSVRFTPRGFPNGRTANLLGGNNAAELLRVV